MNKKGASLIARVKSKFGLVVIAAVLLVIVIVASVFYITSNKQKNSTSVANQENVKLVTFPEVKKEDCQPYSKEFAAKVLPPSTFKYESIKEEALKSSNCAKMGGYVDMPVQDILTQYSVGSVLTRAAYTAGDKESAIKFARIAQQALAMVPFTEKQNLNRNDMDFVQVVAEGNV